MGDSHTTQKNDQARITAIRTIAKEIKRLGLCGKLAVRVMLSGKTEAVWALSFDFKRRTFKTTSLIEAMEMTGFDKRSGPNQVNLKILLNTATELEAKP